MTIDVERIKEYNRKYKENQQKVANLQAELDMNNREIDRLCKELSAELGVQITRENVEDIYEQRVKAINTSLELGENILSRIESEEKGLKESSKLEGELKNIKPQNNMGGMNGNTSNMNGMGGYVGNAGMGGFTNNTPQMNTNGFDTLGGMPQMEIKADEVPNSGGNVKNPFIAQAMGSPIIPQMFSRNGGDVPSLNESDFESI